MEKKCWHPVFYASQLKAQPVSVRLCDEALVLWRGRGGIPYAIKDLCIHRGTALSLGKVCGGDIVCPYHGWRFNGEGKCTLIPQLPDPCKIPPKAKIDPYHCCERYGIIWVSLEEPAFPLPEVPEFEDPQWKFVETGPFFWRAGSARQVENFTDFAHFPFVHPNLLGDPSRTVVPGHKVRQEGNVLIYEVVRPEAPNTEEFPIFANPNKELPLRHSRYRLHLPYTIVLRIGWSGTTRGMFNFFASQPISATECIGYCIIGNNYGEIDEETLRHFEEVIFGQDQVVVESQRPEQVPFDLAAEIHLPFDAVAIAYRKAMKDFDFV